MLKAYKYRIYPNNEQKIIYRLQKHLAVAVLYIIRHWHTGKKYMRKRKNQLVKPTVTITAIDN